MDEQAVRRFWQDHACGDAQVGGLRERFDGDYEEFFTDYDRFRYRNERHIPACIDSLSVAGKQVLEIGLGEGSESEAPNSPRSPLVRRRPDRRICREGQGPANANAT